MTASEPDRLAGSKGASVAPWPGRYFLNGQEVDGQTARAAESEGAPVALGGSGNTPDRLGGGPGPWIELRTAARPDPEASS